MDAQAVVALCVRVGMACSCDSWLAITVVRGPTESHSQLSSTTKISRSISYVSSSFPTITPSAFVATTQSHAHIETLHTLAWLLQANLAMRNNMCKLGK